MPKPPRGSPPPAGPQVSFNSELRSLLKMVEEFENVGVRVIPVTINPAIEGGAKAANRIIAEYNCAIKSVAQCKKLKIADVNSL